MPGDLRLPSEAERRPIIHMKGGEAFADSRDVAAFFGKRHDHVIRDVRNLIAKEPSLGLTKFGENKIKDLTGESTSHFDMDRDGFTLLAMGFTGEKALRWKLRYIEAFNAMELRCRQPQLTIDPSDPAVMLAVFGHLQKQVSEKDAIIVEQGHRLEKLDRIEGADGQFCLTDSAKTLKVRPRDFIARLAAERWIYKRVGNHGWVAYQDKLQAGYLVHVEHLFIDDQGRERVSTRVKVTAKGLVKLAELLNRPLH